MSGIRTRLPKEIYSMLKDSVKFTNLEDFVKLIEPSQYQYIKTRRVDLPHPNGTLVRFSKEHLYEFVDWYDIHGTRHKSVFYVKNNDNPIKLRLDKFFNSDIFYDEEESYYLEYPKETYHFLF